MLNLNANNQVKRKAMVISFRFCEIRMPFDWAERLICFHWALSDAIVFHSYFRAANFSCCHDVDSCAFRSMVTAR